MGDGEFVAMGTLPTSSGRSEGEGVVRVGPEESDVGVRRLTFAELVCAKAGNLKISAINKKGPQKWRIFLESRI